VYRSIIPSCVLVLAACGDGSQASGPVLTDVSLSTAEDTPLSIRVPLRAVDVSSVVFSVETPPSHGAFTGSGPVFLYTPDANYFGPDSVTVVAVDSYGTATATASITVAPVDDAPIAHPDSFATGFDAPLTIAQTTLLANDTDIDSTALTVASVAAGTNGAPALGATDVVFTPDAGFTGTATFTYTIADGGGLFAQASVTVTVGPDTAPVASSDAVTTGEDTPAAILDATLLGNDSDAEHQTLAIAAVGNASHGTVSHAGSQVTFVPDAEYHGAAGFDYTVTDGFKTDVASVVVTVTSVNDAPVAVNDFASTDEDTVLTTTSDELVANDTDIDGDGLAVSAVAATVNTHGSVTLVAGVISYTPAANFQGSAEFAYTVSDGNGGTAGALVTVTVNPINDAPVAVDDAVTASEDTVLVFPASDLVANDTDVETDTLTVISVAPTATTHGTVVLRAPCGNGILCARATNARPAPANAPAAVLAPSGAAVVIRYTPDPDYNGPADFDYTISDGHGGTATGHVAVAVDPVNDAPVVVTTLASLAYTENDAATPIDPLIAVIDIDSAALVGATVQIASGCTSPEDVLALAVPPPGIVIAGYDPATCALTLTGAASPALYQAALRLVTYVNPSEAPSTAPRVVAFTVDDGSATDNLGGGVRGLSVTAVNDAPVAVDDAVTTDEDTELAFASTNLAANDTDVDGDGLTVTAVAATATTHGTVTLGSPCLLRCAAGPDLRGKPNVRSPAAANDVPDDLITYVPDRDYHGPADFDYTVSDGHGGTATGHVAVTVVAINDAPEVAMTATVLAYTENDAAVAIDEGLTVGDVDTAALVGATVQIASGCTSPEDVLALAVPPPGIVIAGYDAATCALTLTGAASPADYQAALRLVTYVNTSDAPAETPRLVVVTVDDGAAAANTGTASRALSVTAVDDAPVAVDDTATLTEDDAATVIAVLSNDTDLDGGPRSIASVTQPPNGTVVITGGGTGLTYQPSADFCNAVLALQLLPAIEAFTYTLAPGGSTATVFVTVNCVDDSPVAVPDVVIVAQGSSNNVLDVLGNDSDSDGGSKAIASITPPSHGIAAITSGSLTVSYTPAPGYCNQAANTPPEMFTYTITPGGSSTTVLVTVTCTCGQSASTDFIVGSNN
jgi:hypothetical protein